MKWVYGKQDWKTFERGLENCYLITNGLGGYSSLTMTGAAARGDHAFFMACTEAPNHRYNMIQRLEEQITVNGKSYIFSTQEYADGSRQEGYRYLSEFSFEDTPVWRFHINGVEIEKEAVMRQGENTIAVCWRVMNRTRSYACLAVTPYFRFAEKGQDICAGQTYKRYEAEECSGYSAGRIESGGLSLEFYTNGKIQGMPETAEQYYYAYDACDGRTETINCVFLYFERTRDKDFAREMYPVMRRIVECYQKGTKYGIHVDSDGLLMAGKDLDQVTWMCGRVISCPHPGTASRWK